MILHKTYYFDAAHYMENFDDNHKYKKVHGHSYELKIVLSGSIKKKFGWVMNFDELDAQVNYILKKLDHSLLNELDDLKNPTCENIAIWVWDSLKKNIRNLKTVEINRPRVGGCIYSGEK